MKQKKIKSQNKWHFVENRTEIIQHVLKTLNLFPTYICVCVCVCVCVRERERERERVGVYVCFLKGYT
jgi:hypothetical protein